MEGIRTPPHSTHSEMALMGAIVASPDIFPSALEAGLCPEWFYVPQVREVFEAWEKEWKRRGWCDLAILQDKAGDSVGYDFIEGMVDRAALPSKMQEHLDELKEKAKARELIDSMRVGSMRLFDGDSCSDVVADVSEHFAEHGADEKKGNDHAVAAIKERYRNTEPIGWQSGFRSINNIVGNWMPGEMVFIAGRPSDGKTTFLLNELVAGLKAGIPAAFASLEMEREQLLENLAYMEAGLNSQRFRLRMQTDAETDLLDQALDVVKGWPLYINDKRMTANELNVWLTSMVMRHGIKRLAVDYLQLIRRTKEEHRAQQNYVVGDWSSGLKAFAKAHRANLFVLSQFSRQGDKRWDKAPPPPSLESMRDSGQCEQDADIVLMIYKKPGEPRESFYGRPDADWPMVVDIQKHRNGPTGSVNMMFARRKKRFMTQHEYDDWMREESMQR